MPQHALLSALGLLITVFCNVGAADAGSSVNATDLIGTWLITSEFCNHCGVSPNADNGNKVVIAKSKYNDPYNFNCPAGAKYVLQDITNADAQQALGVPRDVYPLAATPLTLARLECPAQAGNAPAVPVTSAEMLLLGDGKAIYLWQGSTDFLMKRISK